MRTTGKEKFETSAKGASVTEYPPVGEVVWYDDDGVTCRRWNWRQCTRTALSDATTCVFIIMDALEPCSDESLEAAADELAQVSSRLSPDVTTCRRIMRAE
jgi:DNA/RNA-binding domain of Phe-tRNA-synthetase-like protein